MRILTFVLAALMAGNGVYMFLEPPAWYAAVPGVPDTGPLNLHFVRDIGLAYLTAGAALAWSELGAGWRASALGAMFIGLHSLLHVGETFMGHHHDVILNELAAVHLPAALAIAISILQRRAQA
ncbi:MAG: hypothetical protein K8R92_06170 [Planctomycetes bacterium]|nr:hypothetical protein [Planctomycetota bacterium]